MCPVQLSVDTFIHSNLTHISFSSSIYRRRELQVLVSVITRHTRCVAVVAAHRTTSKSQYAPSVDIQLKRCDHVSSWIKPSEKNCLCLWRCILTYPLVCVSSNTRQIMLRKSRFIVFISSVENLTKSFSTHSFQ